MIVAYLYHEYNYTQLGRICQSFLKIFPILPGVFMQNALNIKFFLSHKGDVQVVIGKLGNAATPGGAGQKAQLH